MAGFGDLLASRVAERASQIVLGLDPDPARLWPRAVELADRTSDPPAARAAFAVAAHCALAIEAVAEQCVAVKLQVACFERLGAPGWAALADVVERAHDAGLIVLADGKRGDIDVSAAAYAQALLGETPTHFGPVRGLGADAITVNPLLGTDALAPFVSTARAAGAGLFVLVRTSNPGAADVQDLELWPTVPERQRPACNARGRARRGRNRRVGAVRHRRRRRRDRSPNASRRCAS